MIIQKLPKDNCYLFHQTFINLPLRPVAKLVFWSYSRETRRDMAKSLMSLTGNHLAVSLLSGQTN